MVENIVLAKISLNFDLDFLAQFDLPRAGTWCKSWPLSRANCMPIELTGEALGALQMHHSKMTGLMHYGRQPNHFQNLIPTQQEAMVMFSIGFHRFFQLSPEAFGSFYQIFLGQQLPSQSTYQPSMPITRKALLYGKGLEGRAPTILQHLLQYLELPLPEDLEPLPLGSRPLPASDPLLNLLQEFLGDSSAQFKTAEQKMALYHMLKGTPNLTIILPTAGGKSTLFLLAASLATARTSIALLPLRGLKDGLSEKAKSFGLPYSIWEEKHQNSTVCPLILASIEAVQNPNFFGFCQQLVAHGQLDRLIFDEAHLIASSNFRSAMGKVKELGRIRTQKVHITATLNNQMAADLNAKLLLPPQLVIRANINQPNIYYSVRNFQNPREEAQSDHFTELMDFIQSFDPRAPGGPSFSSGMPLQSTTISSSIPSFANTSTPSILPSGPAAATATTAAAAAAPVKAIIYFPRKALAQAFFEEYPDLVAPYHGDLDPETRQANLSSFVQSERLILAATTGSLHGYDFLDVNLVIHYISAYGMTDFIQEAGRLSRKKGQIGYSIIYTVPSAGRPRANDLYERSLIRKYILLDMCRRAFINNIYNDQFEQFCLPTDLPCDFCHGRNQVLDSSTRFLPSANQQAETRASSLQFLIKFFQDHCLFCTVALNSNVLGRTIRLGPAMRGDIDHSAGLECLYFDKYQGFLQEFDQSIRARAPPANSCHFACLLPTRFCSQWFSNPATCPKRYPLFLWGAMLFHYKLYFLLPTDLKPIKKPRSLGDFFQWFYQVDKSFFGTEALVGVLAFFQWAENAHKKDWELDF
jgi:superfamily II DNA or RNA helicase